MYTEHGIDRIDAVTEQKPQELAIGRSYNIVARIFGLQENRGENEKPTKMTLIELYPHHARFQRKAGYTESFSYWDLARRLLHG